MNRLTLLIVIVSASSCQSAPVPRNDSRACSSARDYLEISGSGSFVIIEDKNDLEDQCRDLFLGGTFSPQQAIEIMRNAINLLNEESRRSSRSKLMPQAKRLVWLITGQEVRPSMGVTLPPYRGRSTPTPDDDYMPQKRARSEPVEYSNKTATHILELVDSGASFATIHGRYEQYERHHLKRLRNQIEGTISTKQYDAIDSYAYGRFSQERRRFHIVRGATIQTWAMEHARAIGANNFKASKGWLDGFKKRHEISGRAAGKMTSRAKESSKERVESTKFKFLDQFERQRLRFHNGLIFNFDQSGFEYEMSSKRTLSHKGERDTIIIVDQANKASHSYTIQPVVARNGRMIGKLLICMQEPQGKFGPKTILDVREQELQCGNVEVIACQSGKMSAALMRKWVETTLLPPIKRIADVSPPPAQSEPDDEPQPSCSWQCPDEMQVDGTCSQIEPPPCEERIKPTALVLADSWGGNINKDVQREMKSAGIEFLQIPAGTTDELQPCDIEIFRQWKSFVRRLTMQAHYEGSIGQLISRAGVINMQSLIYNQLSAAAYEDLIRYSWRHARGLEPAPADSELVVELDGSGGRQDGAASAAAAAEESRQLTWPDVAAGRPPGGHRIPSNGAAAAAAAAS